MSLKIYLGNTVQATRIHFHAAKAFGSVDTVGVHQMIDDELYAQDYENALYNATRDGFDDIHLYFSSLSTMGLILREVRK